MRLFKINNPVNIDVLPRRIVTRSLLVIITNIAFLSCFITLVKLKSYITIRSEIKSDRYENFVIIANKSGLVNIPKFGLSASISKNECLGIYELSDHTFPKADQYQTLTDLNLARCLTHTDSTINKLKALIINDESINYFVTRLLNNLLYYQSMYNVNAASYSKLVDSYLENQTTNLEIQNLIRTKDSLESALKNLLASSDVRDASLKNQSVISTQYREERLIENIKDKVNSLSREINDYAITTNNYDVNKDFLLRELEFQNKFRNMVNDIELSIFEVKNAELEWKRKYFIIAPQSGYLHLGNYSSSPISNQVIPLLLSVHRLTQLPILKSTSGSHPNTSITCIRDRLFTLNWMNFPISSMGLLLLPSQTYQVFHLAMPTSAKLNLATHSSLPMGFPLHRWETICRLDPG